MPLSKYRDKLTFKRTNIHKKISDVCAYHAADLFGDVLSAGDVLMAIGKAKRPSAPADVPKSLNVVSGDDGRW